MVTKPGQQPSPSRSFILAVDVGTTKIKVCVFEGAKCSLVYGAEESLSLISIDDELVEVDPENLWEQLQQMIKTALANTQSKGTVVAMGLSCQRNTFISWDKRTLKPFHRLITWKDNRARQFCDQWNHSITKRLLNVAGWVAYLFTRSQRFKAARMFRMLGAMVPPRFLVTLKQNPNMRAQLAAGNLALGTMDTWLLLRLSGRQLAFLSEPSSASSTGMFDPFTGTWGQQILRLFGFPHSVLPPLVDTTKIRVHTDETLFGHPILITAMLGDSQAAAFGAGCIRKGDLKISLGTGTLFDFVCGADVHASMCGIYPLVGWKINGESTHLLEGRANETASVFQWAHAVGLLDSLEPSHLEAASERAQRANPGQGQLCFVPAFSGTQTPLDDDYACAAFLGIRSSTTRDQVLRALFESIAFGVYQIWECMMQKVPVARESVCRIRCCGGISQNDFICQQMATLIGRPLERVKEPQFCSAKGAALLAGIANGLWTVAETEELVDVERCFQPVREERSELLARFRRWQQVHWRCLNYYSPHQRQQQG